MKLMQPTYTMLEMIMYAFGFNEMAVITAQYEQLNNFGSLSLEQVLFTGATGPTVQYTNLLNEGPIGYGLLAGTGVFALLFCYTLRKFTRQVRSLSYSEGLEGEVKVNEF